MLVGAATTILTLCPRHEKRERRGVRNQTQGPHLSALGGPAGDRAKRVHAIIIAHRIFNLGKLRTFQEVRLSRDTTVYLVRHESANRALRLRVIESYKRADPLAVNAQSC